MKTRKERMKSKDKERRDAKNVRTILRLKDQLEDLTARVSELEKGK
jgi:hypothetical protein